MRLDRPAGFYAFYFPQLIGLAYAGCISAVAPPSPPQLHPGWAALLLLPFNVLLRGAACTWNDTPDRRFDRRVARCRHRPVARGAVSIARTHLFTAAQLVVLFLLQRACLPQPTIPHTAMVLLFAVYAVLKRVTYSPQVVLGVAFGWAVFLCRAAVLSPDERGSRSSTAPVATLLLFVSLVLWTIVYDTIYAHQDVADDELAGVKGMALRFRHSTKLLAAVLAAVMGGLLALCGILSEFGVVYFVGTVGGVLGGMASYIYHVDLSRPESCGKWFQGRAFIWIGGRVCLDAMRGTLPAVYI